MDGETFYQWYKDCLKFFCVGFHGMDKVKVTGTLTIEYEDETGRHTITKEFK